MQTSALQILRALNRILAALLLLVGIAIWAGFPGDIAPHKVVGMLLGVVLGAITFFGLRSGLYRSALALVAWTIGMIGFGLVHARFLPGPRHWIVRIVHIAIGIVGVILAERVAREARAARGTAAGEVATLA
jgi:uncharacterized membrane protein YuzA (DUF378 family)